MPENHNEHVLLKSNGSTEEQALQTAVVYPKSKWTKYQKLHLAITLLLLAVCIALIGIYVIELSASKKAKEQATSSNKAGLDKKGRVCESPECIALAAQVLTYKDHSVDPCDNFYEYACGGWRKRTYIPDSRANWDTFTDLGEAKDKMLKKTLEANKPEKNSPIEAELYKLYASCTNTKKIESLGLEPLKRLISGLGSWNVTDPTWNATSWDLTKRLVEMHSVFAPMAYMMTTAPLFDVRIAVDTTNSSTFIIKISQPRIGQAQSNKAYPAAMVKVAQLLGAKNPEAAMDEVLKLEDEISKASMPSAMYRNVQKSRKKMTLKELIIATDVPGNKIDWYRYLQLATNSIGFKITNATEVAVQPLVYLEKMAAIVSKTSKIKLANYFMWMLVMEYRDFLPKEITNIFFDIEKVQKGVEVQDPRWQRCLRKVESSMGMALGAMYIRQKFDDKDIKEVQTMIKDIKAAFLTILRDTDWMDEETKKRATEKANAVIGNIAYPSFIKDPVKLSQYFLQVVLNDTTYFANIVKLKEVQKNRNMMKLKKKVDRQEWEFPPTMLNAFYDSGRNKMIFMAAILQSPLFNRNAPKPINYGGIGWVMGHELSHGFDDQGRLLDKNGNMNSWWTEKSSNAYKKRETCIKKQYSQYSLYNISVNGAVTLGENIADNGGIKTAFKAYKTWVKQNGPAQRLPGVNMTDEQLFFLASAQIWCAVERRLYTESSLKYGMHTPDIFRVRGTLSNSKEFAKAYNCPANSPMNPTKKCSVW